MSWLKRAGILPWVLLAIVLGILCGQFFNDPIAKIFVTFNSVKGYPFKSRRPGERITVG